VDAIEYYTNLEDEIRRECDKEKVTAYQEPHGVAFVSFETDFMAAK